MLCSVRVAYAQHFKSSPHLVNLIEHSAARNAFWSVTVRDSSGNIIQQYNKDKLIKPASNLKLLTSAAVLNELGPDYQYKTGIYGMGTLRDSVWNGDIIFRGAGDPSISGTMYREDRFHVFDEYFKILDSLGIRRINGNIIGNDAFFDNKPYPKGWDWDDLSFYYAVEIGALSFNNNTVDLEVFADGKIGNTPRIEWFPYNTDYVQFINNQIITPPGTEYDEYYRRILGTNTIILGSKLPKGYYEKESLSINNPTLYFLDSFKKYLENSGVAVKGSLIVDHQDLDWDNPKYVLLGSHKSLPVDSLLHQINKESNNFFTEMMLKTAAAKHYGIQGSTELGIQLVKEFAHEIKMDTTQIKMTDGSGMSASTLITTNNITLLLQNMRNSPYFESYYRSLSVAGEDGTFSHRFNDSIIKGRIHGKSGYISGVRTMSGYLKSAKNHKLIFSIATNHFNTKTKYVDRIQEQIVKWLYNIF